LLSWISHWYKVWISNVVIRMCQVVICLLVYLFLKEVICNAHLNIRMNLMGWMLPQSRWKHSKNIVKVVHEFWHVVILLFVLSVQIGLLCICSNNWWLMMTVFRLLTCNRVLVVKVSVTVMISNISNALVMSKFAVLGSL
jgi:hypothetical protein